MCLYCNFEINGTKYRSEAMYEFFRSVFFSNILGKMRCLLIYLFEPGREEKLRLAPGIVTGSSACCVPASNIR